MARFEMKVAFPRLVTLTAAFLGLAGASLFASQPPRPPDPAPADALPKHARVRLGSDQFHHGSAVRKAIYTADGRSLVTLDWSSVVRVWDAAEGRIVREIGEPGAYFSDLAVSPQGEYLATTEFQGRFRVWDLVTGRERRSWDSIKHSACSRPSFSSDGRTLAVIEQIFESTTRKVETFIVLRNFRTAAEPENRIPANLDPPWQIAFSPDGSTLAACGIDARTILAGDRGVRGSVRLFDVAKLEERTRLAPEGASVQAVAFSPEGKYLAYAVTDGTVRIRDLRTGQERAFTTDLESPEPAERKKRRAPAPAGGIRVMGVLAFSPDGSVLAGGSLGSNLHGDETAAVIHSWDVAEGKKLQRIPTHQPSVNSLSFAADGKTLASTDVQSVVHFWDPRTGGDARPDPGHRWSVCTVVVSPIDQTVFTGGQDGRIQQWDPSTGRSLGLIASFSTPADGLAISPDGKTLLVGSTYSGRFALWSIAERREIRALPGIDPRYSSRWGAFSLDGKTVASGGRIWDTGAGRVLVSLQDRNNHGAESDSPIFYSSDGKQVITTEREGARVWDVATGKEARWAVRAAIHQDYAVLSPDGRYLATGGLVDPARPSESNPTIRLWELASGQEVADFVGHETSTNGMSFSPDSRLLASAGGSYASTKDAIVRVWDLATGREQRRFTGHRGAVNAVAFTRDGRSVISGSDDATALVWDVADLKNELALDPPFAGNTLQSAWDALASDDASVAYQAGWALSNPSAVGFLQEHLHPATAPDPKGVPAASGPIAPPATLRTLRALAALERVGTPEARAVLEQMGRGHPGAIETRESASTLDRLSRRPKAQARPAVR